MPQQTVSNLCVDLYDENDNSEKFGLHDQTIQRHFQNVEHRNWRKDKNRNCCPPCILRDLLKSNPFITNLMVFASVQIYMPWHEYHEFVKISSQEFLHFPWTWRDHITLILPSRPLCRHCDALSWRHHTRGRFVLTFVWQYLLTHWGRDKMAVIFQTTVSNAFYWMKMHEFRLRFHWSLFLRFELTFQHWFR